MDERGSRRPGRRREGSGRACSRRNVDPAAGRRRRFRQRGQRQRRRAHGELHEPGPAEVDDSRRAGCRRLPWFAVLQDHDCRNGAGIGRYRGRRIGRATGSSPVHRNNCGAWINWPTAAGASCPSRRPSPKSQSLSSLGRGQQFRDAGQVRSSQREATLAVEGANRNRR